MTTENNLSENEEMKNSNEVSQEETSGTEVTNDEKLHEDAAEHDEEHEEVEITLADALKEMEKIINAPNAGEDFRKFNQLKEKASHYIHDEVEDKKHEYVDAGNAPENFSYEHPSQARFSALVNIFKEKNDHYQKGQEEEQKKNLEHRQTIIERLKNLYTNSEPGTNLFKSIREIKEDWTNAGQVAKSEFKILNNNYFHHLNQFYQMLDLNKEFLEQEYNHNLEKRQHIIERAKQLEHEPVIQKALNELQYLHKLWKEEAEPVAEEFREKTWEEFKEISNKIHERKSELSAAIETEQAANLEKKTQIIAEIKKLSEPAETPNHNYWQNSIRRVEDLRSEFLKTGSVPRKLSNQTGMIFKTTLRSFNTTKNTYYKSLKGSQQSNLEEKLKLIQTAQDNQANENGILLFRYSKNFRKTGKRSGMFLKA